MTCKACEKRRNAWVTMSFVAFVMGAILLGASLFQGFSERHRTYVHTFLQFPGTVMMANGEIDPSTFDEALRSGRLRDMLRLAKSLDTTEALVWRIK